MKRVAVWLILLLAFCGMANSAYLVQSETNGTPLLCNINGFSGCNIVAESPYSHLFGVSFAQSGLAFYGLLFFVAALELLLFHTLIRRTIQTLAVIGIVVSLYLTFLQMFVIQAFCIYCSASAILALLVFILAYFVEAMPKQDKVVLTLASPKPQESAPPKTPPPSRFLPMPPPFR